MNVRRIKASGFVQFRTTTVASGNYSSGTCTLVTSKADLATPTGKVLLAGNILKVTSAGNIKFPTAAKVGVGTVIIVAGAHSSGTVQLKDASGTNLCGTLAAGTMAFVIYDASGPVALPLGLNTVPS